MIRAVSLADQAADALRRMILVGDLAPGDRTTQDQLAKLLGVSTMPVREALLKLVGEGLVETEPNRSFTVVRTRLEDIRDIYWMHASFAGELTSRACKNADASLLDEMHAAEQDYLAAMEVGASLGMEAANWRFHKAINLAADAPKLVLMLKTTLRFIPDGFYGVVADWGRVSQQGHREIIETVEAGDPVAAREAARAHVLEAGDLLISNFSAKGFWLSPSNA